MTSTSEETLTTQSDTYNNLAISYNNSDTLVSCQPLTVALQQTSVSEQRYPSANDIYLDVIGDDFVDVPTTSSMQTPESHYLTPIDCCDVAGGHLASCSAVDNHNSKLALSLISGRPAMQAPLVCITNVAPLNNEVRFRYWTNSNESRSFKNRSELSDNIHWPSKCFGPPK